MECFTQTFRQSDLEISSERSKLFVAQFQYFLKASHYGIHQDILSPLGFSNFRLYYIEKEFYLFVENEPSDSLNRIRRNYYQAAAILDGIRIVLTFDKLHPRRKKTFEESKISYYIQNDEMRIFR